MIEFVKYHGAGNDFILIDNRQGIINLSEQNIQFICDRHFGIGGDGLMLLELSQGVDFVMKYYNSDGSSDMMCGNGGRCIVAFAHSLGLIKGDNTTFLAPDGKHSAEIKSSSNDEYIIKLSISDVSEIKFFEDGEYLNTGTSHFVKFCNNVDEVDIIPQGRAIRYDKRFDFAFGVNANFVQVVSENNLKIRTYERGVEDETLACGTGITAAAIAYANKFNITTNHVNIKARGGDLRVHFQRQGDRFSQIYLEGPAKRVFKGEIEI